jgi:lysophospholipase L1-like esterase
VKLLDGLTQTQADEFNATGHEDERAENKKSTMDRTHLNAKGQALFGRMVADTLVRTQVELGPDVVGEPAKAKVAGTQ